MRLRPIGNRIVVRPRKADEVSAGGIVIPDSAIDKPMEGEVIAVGSGEIHNDGTRTAMSINVGETVIFTKNVGQEIKIDGEDLLVLSETDILTVVEV